MPVCFSNWSRMGGRTGWRSAAAARRIDCCAKRWGVKQRRRSAKANLTETKRALGPSPTSAKPGQIWGTRVSLGAKILIAVFISDSEHHDFCGFDEGGYGFAFFEAELAG